MLSAEQSNDSRVGTSWACPHMCHCRQGPTEASTTQACAGLRVAPLCPSLSPSEESLSVGFLLP